MINKFKNINLLENLKPYVSLARPDNWFKNIFIIPGIILVPFFFSISLDIDLIFRIGLSIIATCLVASSNYVINEVLDAETDKHHPVKKNRPSARGIINTKIAYIEWIILAVIGISLSFYINKYVGYANLFLWIMGCLYNIPPIRTKDLVFLDVISESINNPIRFVIGWYSTGIDTIPPISVLFAYWMFGAFLMASKRLAEYRKINNPDIAALYRKSFRLYNQELLITSSVFYLCLLFMSGMAFVVLYRLELVFAVPFFAFLLCYYLHLGFKPDSLIQYPEKLYKEKNLVILISSFLIYCLVLIFIIDLPWFENLFIKLKPLR